MHTTEGVLQNTAAPVAEPRTMSTEVIVESGNTLVIGGVLNIDENSSETGVPILRKIPILGWLFKRTDNTMVKTNLIIMLQPRIIGTSLNGLGSSYFDPAGRGSCVLSENRGLTQSSRG